MSGSRTGSESFGFIEAPYERTTSFMQGAAHGPAEILKDWNRLVKSDGAPRPDAVIKLPENSLLGPRSVLPAVAKAVNSLINENLLPVLLGGEHTVTLGVAMAMASRGDRFGIVQFDAHADLRSRYGDSRYSHACVMRKITDGYGVPVLPIGIRAFSRGEAASLERGGVGFLPGHRLSEWRTLLPPLVEALPEEIYLTIDMDYFDPSVVPGVGTPEPGGGDWYETLSILDHLMEKRNLAGFDIVELCPPRETRVSVRAAARIIRYILSKRA